MIIAAIDIEQLHLLSLQNYEVTMRSIFAAFLVLLALMSAPALSQSYFPACNAPLKKLVNLSPFFKEKMEPVSDNFNSYVLKHKDDPRIIVQFDLDTPYPSYGFSRLEYVSYYEKRLKYDLNYRDDQRNSRNVTNTAEPLLWNISQIDTVSGVGDALTGVQLIRLSETCLIKATFIAPYKTALLSRIQEMTNSLNSLHEIWSPLLISTSWEREDTAPTGIAGIAIGWAVPLILVFFLYNYLETITTLSAPIAATRITVAMTGMMSFGLLINQIDTFMAGLPILKYTDSALLLLTVSALACLTFAFGQRTTLVSMLVALVTGISLLISAGLRWTPTPIAFGAVGFCLFLTSGLGILAWALPITPFDGMLCRFRRGKTERQE